MAQKFGPAEYFSLMVLGLIAAVVFAHGSLVKAIAMILLGLLLGLVGTDVNTGMRASPSASTMLFDGIGFVPLAMGMFGIAEIIATSAQDRAAEPHRQVDGLWPTWPTATGFPADLRGTGLGALLGILPGGSAMLGSFASYSLEKKISRRRSASDTARSKAWRRRRPPTMPARRPPSSRC